MIQLRHFCKAYGRLLAARDISFDVQPGQILGLVGRNGAGKTTTIRAIAGIIPPSSGEIQLCGYSMARQALAAKSQLAYIPDEPQLFDALTVREHLEFVRITYRLPRNDEPIAQLLRDFELTEKQHVPAEELSRGMRQKLGICCAYLHAPRAILFDEPMVGLDPHGIRQVKSTIQQRAQSGAAVVISSHMLAMVEDICTNILILEQGRMQFFGKAEELRQRYGDASQPSTLEAAFFRATGPEDSGSELKVPIPGNADRLLEPVELCGIAARGTPGHSTS